MNDTGSTKRNGVYRNVDNTPYGSSVVRIVSRSNSSIRWSTSACRAVCRRPRSSRWMSFSSKTSSTAFPSRAQRRIASERDPISSRESTVSSKPSSMSPGKATPILRISDILYSGAPIAKRSMAQIHGIHRHRRSTVGSIVSGSRQSRRCRCCDRDGCGVVARARKPAGDDRRRKIRRRNRSRYTSVTFTVHAPRCEYPMSSAPLCTSGLAQWCRMSISDTRESAKREDKLPCLGGVDCRLAGIQSLINQSGTMGPCTTFEKSQVHRIIRCPTMVVITGGDNIAGKI